MAPHFSGMRTLPEADSASVFGGNRFSDKTRGKANS
jgi:hypothetical protein